jgi:hypothetical protein
VCICVGLYYATLDQTYNSASARIAKILKGCRPGRIAEAGPGTIGQAKCGSWVTAGVQCRRSPVEVDTRGLGVSLLINWDIFEKVTTFSGF